jgi:hypothetical protein
MHNAAEQSSGHPALAHLLAAQTHRDTKASKRAKEYFKNLLDLTYNRMPGNAVHIYYYNNI